jgi:hypothetical protein
MLLNIQLTINRSTNRIKIQAFTNFSQELLDKAAEMYPIALAI